MSLYVDTYNVLTHKKLKLEQEIKQDKFKSEYRKLVINLLFTGGWMEQKITQILKPNGITLQQFNILRILKGQNPEPSSVNLLIDRMLDKMSNASRIVDKLEKKNLVTRTICKNDRRAVDVKITDKGLALLKKIEVYESRNEKKFDTLSNPEIKILNNLLDKLRG